MFVNLFYLCIVKRREQFSEVVQFDLNNLVMLLLFSGVVINYYYYVQVSQYVCLFAALDREIP